MGMKLKVDILHGGAEHPVVLCTFRFDGQKVSCTNDTFIKLAGTLGARGEDGRTYFPKDGLPFMHALAVLYQGPHLRATRPVAE